MMKDPGDLGTPKQESLSPKENSSKKRKTSSTVTPRKRNSRNNTPKKNACVNGNNGTTLPVARKLDLGLEAKLSAEENKRMFAGRKIHPFFSMCKVGKKLPVDLECGLSAAKRMSERIIHGPIHVFEDIRDDTSSVNWIDWTLIENTTDVDCGPESSSLHVMEGSVESLNFDNLLSAIRPSSSSISQSDLCCSDPFSVQSDNMMEISPENSAMLANHQTRSPLKPEDAKAVDKVSTASGEACILREIDTEPWSRFLQERMRSYYRSCENKARGSLWINKYKPSKAFEVCGNDESLHFLGDWLHFWHERRYPSINDSSNKDQSDMAITDDIYNCFDCDYASKSIKEEGFLQNVLLITGPVGSGKSAAVYACAQEQGFEILELSASDCRNGAVVKKYFGDALGSRGLRLVEHNVSSKKKTVKLSQELTLPNGKAAEEMDDDVIELISKSNDGAHSPSGTSQRFHDKNNVTLSISDKVQTLILIEDVDILFPEDRGCVAAIQHIAETSKGPIILTSNCNNACLPANFARIHVSFSLPLQDELLCHLYMVCATEEVNISRLLLEKFIRCCDRDIRKTIMQLQFWFQDKKYRKDRELQTVYGSLPFDLQAGHQMLPKIMPWSFPSELSELIENEVAKSISTMKKDLSFQGLVKEELHIIEKHNDLDVQCMGTDNSKPKVELMKINGSIINFSEFESQCSVISELSNCFGPPVTSSLQNDQSKLVAMSSDSMDKDPNNKHFVDVHNEVDMRQSLEGIRESPRKFQLNQISDNMPFCQLLYSGLADSNEDMCKNLEMSKTRESFDISCFPESRFVPENANQNRIKTLSGVVSFSDCRNLATVPQNSDSLVNPEIPKSSQESIVQDFSDANMEDTTVRQMMDDCNRANFEVMPKFVDSSHSIETDTVQDLWRKLRDCRTDLTQYAGSEQEGVIQAMKLASNLSKLFSDADLLFHSHQQKQCGILEPPTFLSDEATISWYNEQMMMSNVAEHGFCFYAKHMADMGSKLGYENNVDITSEMLASTTNIMALGKLSRQDQKKSMSNYTKKQTELNNSRNDNSMQYHANRTSLFDVTCRIVPAKLSLAMKGITLDEYISSLRQISISESFRISQGLKKMRKGRRGAEHYLSRGKLVLSPEDISVVCEGDLYKKISSQYTANMENNCT